jgi:hypothetical protein
MKLSQSILALALVGAVAAAPVEIVAKDAATYTKYDAPANGYGSYPAPAGGYGTYPAPANGYTTYGAPAGGYTSYKKAIRDMIRSIWS